VFGALDADERAQLAAIVANLAARVTDVEGDESLFPRP
jgi:hypothetical protein